MLGDGKTSTDIGHDNAANELAACSVSISRPSAHFAERHRDVLLPPPGLYSSFLQTDPQENFRQKDTPTKARLTYIKGHLLQVS
jgi:hypothetical protein